MADPISASLAILAASSAVSYFAANSSKLGTGATVFSSVSTFFSDRDLNNSDIRLLFDSSKCCLNLLQQLGVQNSYRLSKILQLVEEFEQWVRSYRKRWGITRVLRSGTFRIEVSRYRQDFEHHYGLYLQELQVDRKSLTQETSSNPIDSSIEHKDEIVTKEESSRQGPPRAIKFRIGIKQGDKITYLTTDNNSDLSGLSPTALSNLLASTTTSSSSLSTTDHESLTQRIRTDFIEASSDIHLVENSTNLLEKILAEESDLVEID